ncbi:MAG: lysophospholipid acyltransferase family protein [Rikenellaceae bacterium]
MSRSENLNLLQRIVLEMVWGLCWVIGRLPHFVQFRMLAPALRFVIYRLIGYRKTVVIKNLHNSFPEKSEAEIRAICGRFYTILSEVMVSSMGLSNKRSYRNMFPKNRAHFEGDIYDILDIAANDSWIALTAHFGLWEYMLFWSTFSNQRLMAVYHPLENPIFEELFKRLRGHHKVEPIPSSESLRFAMRNRKVYKGESYLLGLIADQNPTRRPDPYWHTFLNQDTVFFNGGEKIARKIGLPVRFIYQHRLSAGQYEMCYKPIWDGIEEVEPNEITSRYVAMLEQAINEQPEMWLWSHKRWKAKRPKVESDEMQG